MNRQIVYLVLVLNVGLITFPRSALASTCQIPNYQATYKITYFGIPVGKSAVHFRMARHRYVYTVAITSTLFFTDHQWLESSKGAWRKKLPHPIHYQYHYRNRQLKRTANINFYWKMRIPSDTQDKLIYQLSLSHDVCLGKKQLRYHIADGGKLKVYTFKVMGTEVLDTTLGKLSTVKVIRSPIPGKRDTTLWLAPSLHYLAVRATQADSHSRFAVATLDTWRLIEST